MSDEPDLLEQIKNRCLISAETGCWIWQGCTQANGYGRIRVSGSTNYVHRVVYERTSGVLSPGLDVCHSCDVRNCCNPDHLFAGSRLENMRDAVAKGRQAKGARLSVLRRGERSPFAKLASSQVIEIRARRSRGDTTAELAEAFCCSQDNIRRIIRQDTWSHL